MGRELVGLLSSDAAGALELLVPLQLGVVGRRYLFLYQRLNEMEREAASGIGRLCCVRAGSRWLAELPSTGCGRFEQGKLRRDVGKQ